MLEGLNLVTWSRLKRSKLSRQMWHLQKLFFRSDTSRSGVENLPFSRDAWFHWRAHYYEPAERLGKWRGGGPSFLPWGGPSFLPRGGPGAPAKCPQTYFQDHCHRIPFS